MTAALILAAGLALPAAALLVAATRRLADWIGSRRYGTRAVTRAQPPTPE